MAKMQVGLIGLGRMGHGLAARLIADGHSVVGFDLSSGDVARLVESGGAAAGSAEQLVQQLTAPRVVWMMVPHGAPVQATVDAVLPLLAKGDILVDGGNSNYRESMRHAERCAAQGVHFMDVGVSGGVWGEKGGFNIMIGGERAAFERMEPVFRSLAQPNGYAHVGPSGAGHFVKMMHNAIEYAMLQALGEGFECMQRSEFGLDLH
ncbi:MAG TPA: NAD(P)-binding domain-containing protein, partial [Longimicrobiales bacterium]